MAFAVVAVLASLVLALPATAQTPGLVAGYSFAEGSGTTVADVSGNNNTGTLGSGVTWTTQGKFGNALVFNGASFVTIPAAASLNLTTAMTLEAWVYPTTAATNWSTALMREQPSEFVYTLYIGSPGNSPNVFFNAGASSSTERGVAGPSALPVNTWSHLAGTYDGATVRLYVNGAQVASQAFTGAIASSTGALRLGGNGVWGEYFTGMIDEVRIYNRALTPAELQADMNTAVSGAPNTAPTISSIAAQTINEDAATGAISFTVGDAETPSGSLTVTGTSSNPTLVPNGNVVFGGSGANRTVTVTPAANQNGTATITVTVSDGPLSTSASFQVTVNAVNDAPTITSIANQTTSIGTAVGPISFTIGDLETAAASLTVSGSSSNQPLAPDGGIAFGGAGANRTVTVTPAAGQTGTATITVTVSDGQASASTAFQLTVVVANTPPTVSSIAAQTMNEDTTTGAISFTVGDAETPSGSLTVTGTSSNPTVVPNGNVVLGGAGVARTVTVTPAANQNGTATITVTVSDGQLSASTSFLVTVNAVNDAPTITSIANQTTSIGTAVGPISFTVGDLETAAASLTVSGSSSNLPLVPNGSIVFGGTGANRTVTVTPAAGQTGTATITATVSDGQATASTAFQLTVNATPAGLVAGYSFAEGAGTTVSDISGNNNTGTLGSGVTWTAQGKFGGALVFNGASFVTIPAAASLNLTTAMTLEAWVYPTATPTNWSTALMREQPAELVYTLYAGSPANRPNVFFNTGTSASSERSLAGPAALPLNTWSHLAGTYDGATLRLYVNGTQVASQAFTGSIVTSTGALRIGGNGVWGEYFTGRIDEVRIYNRALTPAEILSDVNTPVGGTPPPDTTPPTVAITTPTGGATYTTNTSPMALGGTATDSVGVTQVTWANDRGGSGTASGTTGWSVPLGIALQPGTNVVTVTALDAAGNPGTATLTVSYDPTPPTVAITAPTTETAYTTATSPMELGGTAADNVAVTLVTWVNDRGGNGTATGTSSWTVPGGVALQPGTNKLTVTARDAASNTVSAILTVNYTAPDITPPTVVITQPTAGAIYATNVSPLTLSGTATDNVGVTDVAWTNSTGGGGPAGGTGSWSAPEIALQPGTNVLTVTARDAANNAGVAVLTVTYDTTAPTVSLTAPVSGAIVTGTITLTATASDNIAVAGVQFLVDGVAVGAQQPGPTFSLAWNTGTVPNGPHTLSARARDAAGNTKLADNVSVTVSNALPAGLVAAYSFNEGAGTTVTDVSGNNHTGTLTSGATWTTQGKFGSALVFDGTSGRVTIADAPSLRLTNAMTLEAWVNPTTVSATWRDVIYKGDDNYYLEATSFNGGLPAAGGTFATAYGTATLAASTWTHLAVTYDRATLRLYVNGVLAAMRGQTAAIATSTNPLTIGSDSFYGQYFQGRIDEVRIYNRALTPAEIQTDMSTPVQGGSSPQDPTPPTVAITAPAAGSTVFNLVTVAAAASDNVGIAGVQLLLDGQPLGAEVTSPEHSIIWDTRTAAPGSHTLTAVARDFSNNSTVSEPVPVTVVATTPALVGQWSALKTWPIVAVHAHLLRTGEILAWDGQSAGHNARLWNPTTGVFTTVNNTATNMFCVGQCQLPDGRALTAGGHLAAHSGVTDTNIFNPATRTWSRVASMHTARWYPTLTGLPDGRILVTAGEMGCPECDAPIPEIYDPQANTWTELTLAYLPLPYYPHMFVLPNGKVFAASTSEAPIISRVLDVNTQTWSVVDPNPVDGGSAAMYLPGQVIKSGTSYMPDDPVAPSEATAYVIDMTQPSPAWRQITPMTFPRTYHNMTILPDGDVLVTGGGTSTDAVGVGGGVLPAEIWSPVTETWTVVASMNAPRLYHSNALLMPDARVLILGGGRYNDVNELTDQLSSQFYSPPYLFNGPRPTITSAPTTITYGAAINIQTPDAARIAAVSFMRMGSATHAIDMDQRLVPLAFTAGTGNLSVQTPPDANLAPPGYYLLFILDTNGVPSVAAIMRIG